MFGNQNGDPQDRKVASTGLYSSINASESEFGGSSIQLDVTPEPKKVAASAQK